jgi:hypothetical protein
MKQLPILYSRTSTGAIQQWQIIVTDDKFCTVEGQKDGKLTTSLPTVCKGKNIGKANETSGEDQAIKEAKAKWQKKIDGGYHEDIGDIDTETFTEPMLAHKYGEHEVSFPLASQPKLDGCLSGDTIVKLKNNGNKSLKEIYDNKIEGEILSYNEKKRRNEYKKINGSFKNAVDIREDTHVWYEIQTESGDNIKVTGNHLIYLPILRCWRRVDELKCGDSVLLEE